MTADLNPEASYRRLDGLLAHWRGAGADHGDFTSRLKIDPAHVLVVWGLTAHVYRQAELLRPLLGVYGIELAPLVRAQFETALTVQWLVLRGPKALPGFLNEGVRQRVNLAKTTQAAGWTGASAELINKLQGERVLAEGLEEHARQVHKMISDFAGGESLYAVYRFTSGLAHPSVTVVEDYVAKTGEGAHGVSMLKTPRSGPQDTWVATIVWALVWAGRALDYIRHESPDRHYFSRLARESGMPAAMLTLTDQAQALAFRDRYDADRRRKT